MSKYLLAGALLRAALVASCLRGAFPPVDLRAVCLVRAMVSVLCEVREFLLRSLALPGDAGVRHPAPAPFSCGILPRESLARDISDKRRWTL